MRKIAIIGPESTGKSTLCRELAAHFGTVWCPEYAREYLLQRRGAYDFEDLLKIAKGQLEREDRHLGEARNGLYFIDTEMYVMKVWCEVVFGQCPTWILRQIATRRYDLYLLCRPDLPWAADELREYPELRIRERLFKMYQDIVIHSGVPWAEISGSEAARLQGAVRAVTELTAR